MTIAAILKGKGSEVIALQTGATLKDAVTLLADRRIGAVPVMDGQQVAGILSERDVIYALARDGQSAMTRSVGEVMTKPAVSARSHDTALGALSLMTKRRIRHLPVIEDGAVVGFISIGDLVKYRIERIEADAAAMRDYIQTA